MADGLFEQLKKASPSLPKEWSKVLVPGTAAYETAVLLNASNKLPSLKYSDQLKYENGTYSKNDNEIVINSALLSPEKSDTLAHELTHALRYSMQNTARSLFGAYQKDKTSLSPNDRQFMDAWYKLDPDFTKLKSFQYPSSAYNGYRYSFTEAPAFAVGRMEDPRKQLSRTEYWDTSPGGEHFDATMATEQAILRDLYARQQLKQQEVTNPWWKDPFGFTIK